MSGLPANADEPARIEHPYGTTTTYRNLEAGSCQRPKYVVAAVEESNHPTPNSRRVPGRLGRAKQEPMIWVVESYCLAFAGESRTT
jgi:hypothetical protein